MIPIILWELKQRKSYIFWWTLSTVIVVGLLLMVYPSIRNQAVEFNNAINQLPNGIRQLKSGGSSAINVADPISYLNSQLYYITLPIVQIIMTIGLGSSILARDEKEQTLELLLARPVSRSRVLAAKALAGIAITVITTVAATLLVAVVSPLIDLHIGFGALALTNLFAMLFALSFGAIAFALSSSGVIARRAASAIAIFVSFGGYLLASLSGLTHYLVNPAKALPYHYYNPVTLLNGHVNKGLAIYLIGIFIVCSLLSYVGFRRRDIN